MHRAASQGHTVQLQHLIQSEASVNVVDSIAPLHEPCIRGGVKCVRLLLEAGAQVSHGGHLSAMASEMNWKVDFGALVFRPVSSDDLVSGGRKECRYTALCDACSSGSLDCMRLLLEHGAKANAALISRTASPLHEACMGCYFNRFLASSAFGLNMETYMTVFCLPLFRKCRLCEASDCSGCWSGGV